MGTQKTLPPSVIHSVKGVPKHSFWGGDAACVSAARALQTGAQADSGSSLQSTTFPSPQIAFPIHSSQNICLSCSSDHATLTLLPFSGEVQVPF